MTDADDDVRVRFKASRGVVARTTTKTCFESSMLKSHLFKGRDPEFLADLMQYIATELFKEGECIVKEGSSGHQVFFLHKGSVAISIGQQRVTTLSDGSVFGEMWLLGGGQQSRPATVVALELCHCYSVPHCVFRYLMQCYPLEQAFFAKIAAKRQRELEQVHKEKSMRERDARMNERREKRLTLPFTEAAVARLSLRLGSMRRRATTCESARRGRESWGSLGRPADDRSPAPDLRGAPCSAGDEASLDFSGGLCSTRNEASWDFSGAPCSARNEAPSGPPSRGSSCHPPSPPRSGYSSSESLAEGLLPCLPSIVRQHAGLAQKMRDENTHLRRRVRRLATRYDIGTAH